jgi:hypothetical protein
MKNSASKEVSMSCICKETFIILLSWAKYKISLLRLLHHVVGRAEHENITIHTTENGKVTKKKRQIRTNKHV